MKQEPISKLVASLSLFASLVLLFIFSTLFLLRDNQGYNLSAIIGFGFFSFLVIILAIVFVSYEPLKEIVLSWSKEKKELKIRKEKMQQKLGK